MKDLSPKSSDTQKVFLLSLGQLVNSDINKSLRAFTKLVHEGDSLIGHALTYAFKDIALPRDLSRVLRLCYTCFSAAWLAIITNSPFAAKLVSCLKSVYGFLTYPLVYLFVYHAFIIDRSYFKTIERYKNGAIESFEVFKRNMCAQLWQNPSRISDESFKAAWNAMCEISQSVKDDLRRMISRQKEHTFAMIILCDTNPTHFDYIQNQLKERGISLNTEWFIWMISYKSPTIKNLASSAIELYHFDQPGVCIVSLHNKITKAEDVNLSAAEFRYTPYDTGKSGAALSHIIRGELGLPDTLFRYTRRRSVQEEAKEAGVDVLG